MLSKRILNVVDDSESFAYCKKWFYKYFTSSTKMFCKRLTENDTDDEDHNNQQSELWKKSYKRGS